MNLVSKKLPRMGGQKLREKHRKTIHYHPWKPAILGYFRILTDDHMTGGITIWLQGKPPSSYTSYFRIFEGTVWVVLTHDERISIQLTSQPSRKNDLKLGEKKHPSTFVNSTILVRGLIIPFLAGGWTLIVWCFMVNQLNQPWWVDISSLSYL